MSGYQFEREVRTPSSECYAITNCKRQSGRLDVHFAKDLIHCTLVVSESLTREDIDEILELIFANILTPAESKTADVGIHIHQGIELDLYPEEEENDGNNDGREQSN